MNPFGTDNRLSSTWDGATGHAVEALLAMSLPGSGLSLKDGLASSLSSFSASFSMMGTLSFLHMFIVGMDPDRLLPERLPNLLPG